jgi:hypothetical protein
VVNVGEARAVLDLARMLDNKIGEVDDAKAALWAELLPDVEIRAAVAAIKAHYAVSADTVMPAHIKPAIRRLRADWREAKRRADQLDARRALGPSSDPRVIDRADAPRIAAEARESRSPRVAEALAEARRIVGPGRPSALRIGGSMRRHGESSLPRAAREPSRLGDLLRDVQSRQDTGLTAP